MIEKSDQTMHAAGGLFITAGDLARWLELQTSEGRIDGTEQVAPLLRRSNGAAMPNGGLKLFNRKVLTRNVALAGAFALLLGSSAFAQDRGQSRTDGQNRREANRMVEGTVESVEHARNGERVRLTNGMDLVVPNSVIDVSEGRRRGASTLRPGDVVRMTVYSREGDGRDARVRTLEILRTGSRRNDDRRNNDGDWRNNDDRRLNGTVVSVDRRGRSLVMETENDRTITVDLSDSSGVDRSAFRRGDRISVTGRMNRGTFVADEVRLRNNRR